MAIILGIGVFIGVKLDAHFGTKQPYLTALCAVIAFPIAFYSSVKDLL